MEGEGPPLVMSHSLSSSLKSWYQLGYVDRLRNDFTIILMDARGHGQSDKPHDTAAYTGEQRAGDVTAVLDSLNIRKAHFLGYSYGGRVGYELAIWSPNRFFTLIIGAGLYGPSDPKDVKKRLAQLALGPDAIVAKFKKNMGSMPAELEATVRGNDYEALKAIAIALADAPELTNELSSVEIPILLYIGENDHFFPAVQTASKLLPNAELVIFPGLNHLQVQEQPDLVLPRVREFIARQAEQTH